MLFIGMLIVVFDWPKALCGRELWRCPPITSRSSVYFLERKQPSTTDVKTRRGVVGQKHFILFHYPVVSQTRHT